MRIAIVLLALTVAACATPEVTGNSDGGITSMFASNEREVFAAAQAHCAKYGRNARITDVQAIGSSVSFECVKP